MDKVFCYLLHNPLKGQTVLSKLGVGYASKKETFRRCEGQNTI